MKIFMVIIFLLFYSVITVGQSIAPDGDFDTDIIGWHCGSVNPIWRSDEGSGLSGNGSLQISHENFISNGGELGGGTCDWVVVTPLNDYKFTGFYKLPTNSEFENISIDLYWFTEAENYISVDSLVIPTNTITRNVWTPFDLSKMAPVDATKLAISLTFQFYPNGQDEVSAFLLWDDLYLVNYTDEIFSDGFE
jgi:hypothetical protein